jgi:hypothetical protein
VAALAEEECDPPADNRFERAFLMTLPLGLFNLVLAAATGCAAGGLIDKK